MQRLGDELRAADRGLSEKIDHTARAVTDEAKGGLHGVANELNAARSALDGRMTAAESQQAASAAEVVRLIGLPEGLYPLSQATIYLANAPKSNAIKRAYMAAAEDAAATASEPVPLHLRNAVTGLMKGLGYGQNYRYVHDDPAAKDQMRCLPESLAGRVYWDPEPDSA